MRGMAEKGSVEMAHASSVELSTLTRAASVASMELVWLRRSSDAFTLARSPATAVLLSGNAKTIPSLPGALKIRVPL